MSKRKELAERKRPDAFSLRLDPKVRFAAELAAAKERRSLSSLVEWALDQALRKIVVAVRDGEDMTAMRVADEVWDGDEARRLLLLAAGFPSLLTSEQQQLRNLIVHNRCFMDASQTFVKMNYDDLMSIKWQELRENWDTLKQVAGGLLPEDDLPLHEAKTSSGEVNRAKQAKTSKTATGQRSSARKTRGKLTT